MNRALAVLAFVLSALPAQAQTVTAISARPAKARSVVSFAYGDLLRFAVHTATAAGANELKQVQMRVFRGSIQDKLDNAAARPGESCYYYESLVLRPVVLRPSRTESRLDFARTVGAEWASAGGKPVVQHYTIVFEKVPAFDLAPGEVKRQTFAVTPATHNTYFGGAIDLIIDPGALTAAAIRTITGGGRPLPPPPRCPTAISGGPAIEVAGLQPTALRPQPSMTARNQARGMIVRRAR